MVRLRMFPYCFGLVAFVSSLNIAIAETQPKWTDTSGKFSIVADFVRVDKDVVVLRKPDGTEVRVPMAKLSSPSRVQARKAAKEMGPVDTAPSNTVPSNTITSDSMITGSSKNQVVAATFPEGMSCQQTVQYLIDESAKGNYRVLFDSLPAKHRADVTEIMQLAGKQFSPELFQAIEQTSDRVFKILRSKKQLILGSQMLAQFDASKYQGVYDAGVNMLDAIVAMQIMNPKLLQSSDPGTLLGAYIKRLSPASEKLMQAMKDAGIEMPQQNQLTDLKNINFTVEEKSSTESLVTIDTAGKKQSQTWMRIDGRWVQNDIIKDWDANIQKAKMGLDSLTGQSQKQVIEQMKMLDVQFLSKLESVKTQQELDAMLVPILMMAGPMMQQMGGIGAPGVGVAPPPFVPAQAEPPS